MTCNSAERLSLAPYVNPQQLLLRRPSATTVLEHLVLVAVCEGLHTDVASLLQLTELCQNDVRWLHTLCDCFVIHTAL